MRINGGEWIVVRRADEGIGPYEMSSYRSVGRGDLTPPHGGASAPAESCRAPVVGAGVYPACRIARRRPFSPRRAKHPSKPDLLPPLYPSPDLRQLTGCQRLGIGAGHGAAAAAAVLRHAPSAAGDGTAVSYTHLTLPTIA